MDMDYENRIATKQKYCFWKWVDNVSASFQTSMYFHDVLYREYSIIVFVFISQLLWNS
jgi:hypothetical protein